VSLNRILDKGIEITAGVEVPKHFLEILTPEALRFVAHLHRSFDARRKDLLFRREVRYLSIKEGVLPDFLPETAPIRKAHWKVAAIPDDLQDRRVEITGPVDRKMVINALNSGASCYMADFEDSHCPTFANTVNGQINIRDAVRGDISISQGGKTYALNKKIATLLVRPRGWHLVEKHVTVDGAPVSGSIYDFALYFFHNAKAKLAAGSGPYFYLPKMESHLEARLWNDVFNAAQDYCGVPRGSIRATVLIETILAAFEMDEILYELRDHSAGLNCGRWDYMFSYIKKFRDLPAFVLPERGQVTMTVPFMDAYVRLLIKTCHRRGIHAMGGMSAFIPVKDDEAKNKAAMAKVEADKVREVTAGHDGTWVAHPALIPVAKKIFDEHMKTPNQIFVARPEVNVVGADLLRAPSGTITEEGLFDNISVSIQYTEAWLRGVGCIPINNMMEDAATAEIARAQVFQWIKHGAKLSNGHVITKQMVSDLFPKVLAQIKQQVGAKAYDGGRFPLAADIMKRLCIDECADFLTLEAYNHIN